MPACQPLGPSVGLTCRKAGEALPRSRPNQPASPACSLPAPLARTPRGTFGWGGKAGGSAVLGGARAHPESARERARDLSAPEKANVESRALLVGRQGEEGKKERKRKSQIERERNEPSLYTTKGARDSIPCSRRPRVEGDDPPNLSILISGGKETNRDSLSKCDRNGKSPAQSLASPSRGARGVLRSGEVLHALPSRLSCS